MQNPGRGIPKYLNTLINRFLNTKSIHEQLKNLSGWRDSNKIETFKLGSFFFRLAEYSMSRIVLVELAAFTSSREDKSLRDWLEKAREHVGSLEPKRYSPPPHEHREVIDPDEYVSIVDKHISKININKTIIDNIKNRRDESIAHFDSKFFGEEASAAKEYPLKIEDIDELINEISEILSDHHCYLMGSDIDMHVHAVGSIDSVLDCARAFQRMREDKDLIQKGIRPWDYLGDDYE